jgi:arsenate reductase (thioredoxin)
MNILFLCPHGAMKSIMAAAYTQKFALEAGIDLTVAHAGTEPDEIIPQTVIDLLAVDGIDVSVWHPNLVSNTDLERANRIISLGCEIPEIQLETWVVPSPSENLIASSDAIKTRVQQLILDLHHTKS